MSKRLVTTMLALGLASGATTFSAAAVFAGTIDFQQSGSNVPSVSFNQGGVSGTVTSFSTTGSGSEITRNGDGLGVETLYDQWYLNDTSDSVDGFPGVEGLRFDFDTAVFLHEVNFGRVTDYCCSLLDDDWTVKVDGGYTFDDSTEDPFDFVVNGVTGPVMWFSVEANGWDDDWTVASFKASPVPLPAAGWMLIAGIGGLAAVGRRRKKAEVA